MSDRFEIQREHDQAAEVMLDEALGKLEEAKVKARQRRQRLLPLGRGHYFDPLDRQLLVKEGSQFKPLDHRPSQLRRPPKMVEAEARTLGCRRVQGGLFWSQALKRLYAKRGGRYVLYALDRRKAKPGPGRAAEGPFVSRRSVR